MKHAILILAHNNAEVIKCAARILDDSRFTFYLHFDKKAKKTMQGITLPLKYARCVEIPSIPVNWAGYSMVQAEINLIEAAVEDGADYIHLFQGADLPLKTPHQIDRFFENNEGKNYICFQPERYEFAKYKALCRHFFVDFPSYRNNMVLKVLNHSIAKLQQPFVKKRVTVYHSSALFSITHDFATYLMERKEEIRKRYRFALAPDELFVCNLFMESPFCNTLGDEIGARLIDWERREGNSPRTFRMEDIQMLDDAISNDSVLFARKFSWDRDCEIVKKVEERVIQIRESEEK